MSADLFISYAWTSIAHREWVRLFASHLHLAGYVVKIDEAVDYGSSLHGFMREVIDSAHVLLIADENYVERANTKPESGVGIETKWISGAFSEKPPTWLSVVFVGNSEHKLPDWLIEHNPKGFDFNFRPISNNFPGSAQIEEIWRWIQGLPADKSHAVPLSLLRERAARLERVDASRDPGLYANPALSGSVAFRHSEYFHYTVGYGQFEFKVSFSSCSRNSVYVYAGDLKAVGLITSESVDPLTVASFITPGRAVVPSLGQRVVLLNHQGIMCIIRIDGVQQEVNSQEYVPAGVTFTYEILERL